MKALITIALNSRLMGTDISEVCFVGVYSHNQDDVLRGALKEKGITVTEVSVPIRSIEEAKEQRRLPIRPMRPTINWFSDLPCLLFPFLFAAALFLHTALTFARVPFYYRELRSSDALIVPHMGDTSVFAAAFLKILFGSPVIYFSHNGIYIPSIQNRGMYPEGTLPATTLFYVDRLLHLLSDRVVVFSDESGDRFAETYDIPRERYETIYISVVESNFQLPPETTCPRECDILYWGNFHPHHGVQTMVQAAARMPNQEFVFLGQSDKRDRIVEEANRLGLENASFPGFVPSEELVAHIETADAVLGPVEDNPQTEFTIGTKVAEAAYLEKAILIGANPAPMEVFEHRESAHLVDPGNAEELADGVKEICRDNAYRQNLEAGARSVYDRHLAPENAADRLLEIIASC